MKILLKSKLEKKIYAAFYFIYYKFLDFQAFEGEQFLEIKYSFLSTRYTASKKHIQ